MADLFENNNIIALASVSSCQFTIHIYMHEKIDNSLESILEYTLDTSSIH